MAGKANAGNVLNPLNGGIASEIAVIIGTQVAWELGKVAVTSLRRIIRQPWVEQEVERVDNIQTVFVAQPKELAKKRQAFHFDFLNHTLKQSEWTLGLSMAFMSGGALIVLTGAALALVHAGKPDRSYVPIVTNLTGGLLTSGGGALALHWKRTTANLVKAAESNEKKIDNDHNLEVAMTFIDRVEDPQERDRLNSTAALKALGVQAQPETMVSSAPAENSIRAVQAACCGPAASGVPASP